MSKYIALQGAFKEHINVLSRLPNVESTVEIRTPEQLSDGSIDGLILPGGESTTMALVAERSGMMTPLKEWVQKGNPTWVIQSLSFVLYYYIS